MEKSLSISNFSKIPYGIVWMIIMFVLVETATQLLWNPTIIGERLYGRFDPSYNYGYDSKRPIFYKNDDKYVCYPTQYLNIHKQTLSVQKDENEFRIFTFGGSISRGEKDSNYSFFLAKILNSYLPQKKFQAVNLSADGYGSSRMLLLLNKVIKFKPDLLIWHVHGSNEYEDERDLEYRNTIHSGLNRVLFGSHFFVILKKCYSYITAFESTTVTDTEDEREASLKTENFQRWCVSIDRNLREMSELAERHSIPVFLVGRVERNFGNSEFETQRVLTINNIIEKHAQGDVHYIDTPMIMQKEYSDSADREALFVDSSHWVLKGHELVAREIADDIMRHFCLNADSEVAN